MQFLAMDRMNPAYVEATLHQIQGCSMRALVHFLRVYHFLNLCGQKPQMDVERLAASTLAFCTVCGLRLTVRFCFRIGGILRFPTRLTCSTYFTCRTIRSTEPPVVQICS